MVGREKEIVQHLTEEEIDRLLSETDNAKTTKRLIFIKRIYKGATLTEAADDVGKSSGTGSNWAKRWNEGGLGKLTPNFGGGRPRKLSEDQLSKLEEYLERGAESFGYVGERWISPRVKEIIEEKFGVSVHRATAVNLCESYQIR